MSYIIGPSTSWNSRTRSAINRGRSEPPPPASTCSRPKPAQRRARAPGSKDPCFQRLHVSDPPLNCAPCQIHPGRPGSGAGIATEAVKVAHLGGLPGLVP
jgi:hypothetical protein